MEQSLLAVPSSAAFSVPAPQTKLRNNRPPLVRQLSNLAGQAGSQAQAAQQSQLKSEGANEQPFVGAGQKAVGSLSNLLAPGGQLTQGYGSFTAPTGVTEQNDPGYQFRLQQGQNALQNSAAARGGLLSTEQPKTSMITRKGLRRRSMATSTTAHWALTRRIKTTSTQTITIRSIASSERRNSAKVRHRA